MSYKIIKKVNFIIKNSLKLNPNSKEILINLAYLEQSFGKFENANSIYKKLLILYPDYIETYYRMYLLNSNSLKEKYKNLFFKINKKNTSLHERSLANYLLSKIKKKRGEYKLEIDYLKKKSYGYF